MIIDIISYLFAIGYIYFICRFWYSWKKTEKYTFHVGINKQKEVSIVVVFKNEKKNLQKLIAALNKQTYTNFELILVYGIRIQVHSFACIYPIFPPPFIDETISAPLNIPGTLVKD